MFLIKYLCICLKVIVLGINEELIFWIILLVLYFLLLILFLIKGLLKLEMWLEVIYILGFINIFELIKKLLCLLYMNFFFYKFLIFFFKSELSGL